MPSPGTVPRTVGLTVDSVVTPLSPQQFDFYLSRYKLHTHYPSLINNIIIGFPIALSIAPIKESFTPRNHYKTEEEAAIVQVKVDAEVQAGRMSGPFSFDDARAYLGGHFRTSPLAVVPKDGGTDWRMVQNLSFEDPQGVSVNSLIDSDDFPTTWSTAQICADYVSVSFILNGGFHCLLYFLVENWNVRMHGLCPKWPEH